MDSRSGARPHPGIPVTPAQPGAWRFTVAPSDLSVPAVRHAVRDLLRSRHAALSPDRLDDVLLILTELVTNAVRHAALLTPQIGVQVELDDHWVRLAVEDGHPYRPRALQSDPLRHETGGRGLLLVRALAEEAGGACGVTATAGGKTVWAALPVGPD
jgi:two-component sensor histidine kinase